MATLSLVSNGYALAPALPINRSDVLIADEQRMTNGQLRRALKGTGAKKRLSYGRPGLSEAERAIWVLAHPWTTSYSHTDELGVTRTVVTMAFEDTLSESKPSVEGGSTGATYYDVTVEVEEV